MKPSLYREPALLSFAAIVFWCPDERFLRQRCGEWAIRYRMISRGGAIDGCSLIYQAPRKVCVVRTSTEFIQ